MRFKNKHLHIACDGGAATGKSTAAKMVSKKFNLKFLSSGLLYRYASYLILKNSPKNKITFLRKKFKNLKYKEIEKLQLHTTEISEHSSIIAKNKNIRKILKNFQIRFQKIIKNVASKEEIFQLKSFQDLI